MRARILPHARSDRYALPMTANMAIDFDALHAAGITDEPCRYDERDAMLYALGLGFGRGVDDPRELDFVFEGAGLRTVPTMAGMLVSHAFLADTGWAPSRVSTVEQKLELFRPLPPAGDLRADSRVVAVLDHGREAGVSILVESEVRMARDGTVLFNLAKTLVVASDGGTSGPAGRGPLPHRLPAREPDLACDLSTYRSMPFLFRLSGGAERRRAGGREATTAARRIRVPLDRQCVAGLACRAILNTICEYDFTLIGGFDLRFIEPIYAGETLTTEMWQERNVVSFRAVVRKRNAVVIDNGKCTLTG